MTDLSVKPGDRVVIAAFDDVPEHEFQVDEVLDDCMTGVALTWPLAGEYGEPERSTIVRVLGSVLGTSHSPWPEENNQENREASERRTNAPDGGVMSVRIQPGVSLTLNKGWGQREQRQLSTSVDGKRFRSCVAKCCPRFEANLLARGHRG
jgi:hypothetical protein